MNLSNNIKRLANMERLASKTNAKTKINEPTKKDRQYENCRSNIDILSC